MGNGLFAMRQNFHRQHRVHVSSMVIGEQVLNLLLRYFTKKNVLGKYMPERG
jgi:hypothetical protein